MRALAGSLRFGWKEDNIFALNGNSGEKCCNKTIKSKNPRPLKRTTVRGLFLHDCLEILYSLTQGTAACLIEQR